MNRNRQGLVSLMLTGAVAAAFLQPSKAEGQPTNIQAISKDTTLLMWDPSPAKEVTGYYVLEGGASRQYTNKINAPNLITNFQSKCKLETNVCLSPPIHIERGTQRFYAVTAHTVEGAESDFSNEVIRWWIDPISTSLTNVFGQSFVDFVYLKPVSSTTGPKLYWSNSGMTNWNEINYQVIERTQDDVNIQETARFLTPAVNGTLYIEQAFDCDFSKEAISISPLTSIEELVPIINL